MRTSGAGLRFAAAALGLLLLVRTARRPLGDELRWLELMRGRMTAEQYDSAYASDPLSWSVPQARAVARYVEAHTEPSDRVLVWSDPTVNYLTGRPGVGRPHRKGCSLMKKSALALSLVALVFVTACKKTPRVQPSPPPAPVAPATPPPAPEPPPTREVAPVEDEYARMRRMATDEIERMGILAEIHFDYDRADIREADRAIASRRHLGE